eukprot:TRINITY_DN695_c0_g3_i1.p1 TRINITY_DN695_c0_g3~~TRINITY_DN695_c0_g3_i1.p1  ORF type:complete len:221 (+),score=15.46 TRINITY_DN695_c0_g3_i1:133-795(+)
MDLRTTGNVSEFDIGVGRLFLAGVIIALLAREQVRDRKMKRFVHNVILALVVEETILAFYTLLIAYNADHPLKFFFWRIYETIRIFVNLSFNYPIQAVLGKKPQELQKFFFLTIGLVFLAAVLDYLFFSISGLNFIVFFMVFTYTHNQYKLMKASFGDTSLAHLILIEKSLMFLSGFLIVCFFIGFNLFVPGLRFCIGIIQYFKAYLVVSAMTSFVVTSN